MLNKRQLLINYEQLIYLLDKFSKLCYNTYTTKGIGANTVKCIAPPIDIEKREAKIVGFS
jgi:hypothetical protein